MVIVNIIKKEDSNAVGLSDLQNCNHKIVTLYCTWKIFQGGKLSGFHGYSLNCESFPVNNLKLLHMALLNGNMSIRACSVPQKFSHE